MDRSELPITEHDERGRLLATLERLLALEATEVREALMQASELVAEALGADVVDVFLYDATVDTLVSVGSSDTELARRQAALGLDRQAVANGGRCVGVFRTGISFITGHADTDPDELMGIKHGLEVRSMLAAPLSVRGERGRVLWAASVHPDHFSAEDLRFLEAVAHWVGLIVHRAELVERLTHDAAEQARRVAAEELITILAHDFRAPLTPLQGRIGLIRSRAEREGRARDVDDADAASAAADRLLRLTTDLLDVARLERGLFALSIQVVDLAALVRRVARSLQPQETAIHVRTQWELMAAVDPGRLEEAIENLLSYACRHTPTGAPVSLVLKTDTRPGGEWAVISVHDSGPGISPDLLPRLFERFARGPSGAGLGLGLYLARSIAEAHGGTLAVESAPGQGATFRLMLPLAGDQDEHKERKNGAERNHHQDRVDQQAIAVVTTRRGNPRAHAGSANQHAHLGRT